jgi:SAM-dependent methyltransferase
MRDPIKKAKRRAREEGIDGVRYKVADCNALRLPRDTYDGVFFHGSLHHISDPDTLLAQVAAALKHHGPVYIDDYIGPSRDEWTDDHLEHARKEFNALPQDLRLWDVDAPLDWRDPSEMIRSSRILPAFRANFEELHYRSYWGNLLFPLLCAVDGEKLRHAANQHWIEKFVSEERRLTAAGEFTQPLFAVLLGRRRQ